MSLKRLSPLRYPGGKTKVLDFIIKIIESNNYIGSEYVEPYAGGAGVALGLLFGEYVSKIHINDIDIGIYSFWKSILNNTEEFIRKIEKSPISVNEWKKHRHIYKNSTNYTALDVGFATFYLNRCNRSGIITAGCIGGQNQAGEYKLDARFNKTNLISRISKIALFRDKIEVYNQDTLSLINKNKHQFRNMILYLDPPYYVKGSSLYRNFYQHKDHEEISNIVKSVNSHWVVSYDNVPEIVKLYSDKRKKEFSINYSAGVKKKGKEIMFFSDNLLIPKGSIVSSQSLKYFQ
ncbi:DNA adenine methylase [Portibacter marinus]|uniref:DNA adenine methylase n=1 Tax=Portibacter marinus TaxID=2898660 RepID=UPI001F46A2D0|nr:DNA adenine methylase [Portibacter marinus]